MRVFDTSPITVGIIVICLVDVGKSQDIDWIQNEILLIRGIHHYVHWFEEESSRNDIHVAFTPTGSMYTYLHTHLYTNMHAYIHLYNMRACMHVCTYAYTVDGNNIFPRRFLHRSGAP